MFDNTEYKKNSLFVNLFSELESFTHLYNALSDEKLNNATLFQLKKFKDILNPNFRNNICFLTEDNFIVIVEVHSTINNNMPLFFLDYISKAYEQISDYSLRFRHLLVKRPTPQFLVLYNGTDNFPYEKILKLSDMFKAPPKNKGGILELKVRVININKEGNYQILTKCKELNDYSIIIAKIREYMSLGHVFRPGA
jgi:hypothetical protein